MPQEDYYFSVVIPTHNRKGRLVLTLDSVLAQSFKDYEIIIVDDGSDDGTRELIQTRYNYLNVHYLWQKGSGGPAKPRNVGIRLAKGKWICFLDSDDLWYSDKLEILNQEIQNHEKSIVFCHYEHLHNLDTNQEVLLEHGKDRDLTNAYSSLLMNGNCLSPSATAVNRDFILEKKILFNESPRFVAVEDYDFWLHLAWYEAKIHFIKIPLGKYVLSGSDNLIANHGRMCSNLLALYRYHTFEVQSFMNSERLFRILQSKISYRRAGQALREKKIISFVKHLSKSFLTSPSVILSILKKRVFR
jgi:glycosyltransferase involved in cell wall biosynthesis